MFDKPDNGGLDGKSVEELAAGVKKMVDEAVSKVKEIAEDALGKAKSGEQLTDAAKTKADEALVKMNTLTEQLAELQQVVAKQKKGGGDDRQKSIGEQFVEGDGFKAFADSGFSKSARGGDLKVKATLTSATTDAAGSVGDAVRPTHLPGIQELPQRRLTVRDLISPGRMDGSSLDYVVETGFTNNAGMVAEGATKPSSDIKFELKSTSAKVIAHWMKASKQILSDVSQLRSIIDQRLLYGLAYKEEQQLLNGDGTGQNLYGIIPQATAYAPTIALSDLNILDVLRLAMLQAALAEYPATGHVLNPIDWAKIETLKDNIGRYIIGDPQDKMTGSLWRLPVVDTQAMAQNKFLTGAFRLGAQLFDRWDGRVEAGYESDDFIKNLVTILAEERLALAVNRPEAFIYGDFDAALAA
ncbi:MAG TPA: phage major capsid protein [Bosea sp. (in: a-proteobacteria)]|uniref:phage major capsid protein n=1 Tax=Bosea sp. (in: a-proteobacteria) TaxID=1871050 RepID=UPI002DDCEA02|nr:phage major capsid protein [Bosea sp. (in: a-proteobacteria)]HEV2552722.1 phage major capsid protein [Bosea sp. (in: a-proteobacteria)]